MDVITSFFSWGWHYHAETYLKDIVGRLKAGTIVIADVRVDAVADYDAQKNSMSKAFGCEPKSLKTYRGWKKSKIVDPNLSNYIKNNASDYGETKGSGNGPKGHRFKWVIA